MLKLIRKPQVSPSYEQQNRLILRTENNISEDNDFMNEYKLNKYNDNESARRSQNALFYSNVKLLF